MSNLSQLINGLPQKKKQKDKIKKANPARESIRNENYYGYLRENGKYGYSDSKTNPEWEYKHRPTFSDRKYTKEQLTDIAEQTYANNIFKKAKKGK